MGVLSFTGVVDPIYISVLLAPPFLLLIYYITFGRKKYLILKESKH